MKENYDEKEKVNGKEKLTEENKKYQDKIKKELERISKAKEKISSLDGFIDNIKKTINANNRFECQYIIAEKKIEQLKLNWNILGSESCIGQYEANLIKNEKIKNGEPAGIMEAYLKIKKAMSEIEIFQNINYMTEEEIRLEKLKQRLGYITEEEASKNIKDLNTKIISEDALKDREQDVKDYYIDLMKAKLSEKRANGTMTTQEYKEQIEKMKTEKISRKAMLLEINEIKDKYLGKNIKNEKFKFVEGEESAIEHVMYYDEEDFDRICDKRYREIESLKKSNRPKGEVIVECKYKELDINSMQEYKESDKLVNEYSKALIINANLEKKGQSNEEGILIQNLMYDLSVIREKERYLHYEEGCLKIANLERVHGIISQGEYDKRTTLDNQTYSMEAELAVLRKKFLNLKCRYELICLENQKKKENMNSDEYSTRKLVEQRINYFKKLNNGENVPINDDELYKISEEFCEKYKDNYEEELNNYKNRDSQVKVKDAADFFEEAYRTKNSEKGKESFNKNHDSYER